MNQINCISALKPSVFCPLSITAAFPLLVLLLAILSTSSLRAQAALDRRITIEAKQEKLSSVLNRLGESEKLNFSFNPADPSFSAPVTYKATNKTLGNVLKDILTQTGHHFRSLGGQIVIFSASPEISEPKPANSKETHTDVPALPLKEKTSTTSPSSGISTPPVPDTVLIRDTIILIETQLRIDTLVIHDTIVIEKEKPKPPRRKGQRPLREDLFRQEPDRDNGWHIEAFAAPFYNAPGYKAVESKQDLLNKLRQAEAPSILNYSLASNLIFASDPWHFTIGVDYTQYANKFRYSYTLTEGGFFINDTIDSYYTVTNTPPDTLWFYITEPVWLPLKESKFDYDMVNRLRYIEFPFAVGYTFLHTSNTRWYLRTGLHVGFVFATKGYTLSDSAEYPARPLDDFTPKSPVLSFSIESGMRFRLIENLDLGLGVFFKKHINPVFENHPIETRSTVVALKAGLVYYF